MKNYQIILKEGGNGTSTTTTEVTPMPVLEPPAK